MRTTRKINSKSRNIEFHLILSYFFLNFIRLSSLSMLIWFNLINVFFSIFLYSSFNSIFVTVMYTTCGTIKKSRGSLSCCLSSFSHREQWTAVIPHESLHQWCWTTTNWSWCSILSSRTQKVGIQWLGKFSKLIVISLL